MNRRDFIKPFQSLSNGMLEKGQQVTICPECRHVVNPLLKSRVVLLSDSTNPSTLEIGSECPFCQYWIHSYFINDHLLQRAVEVKGKSRQVRREYRKEFKKFQKKMKCRLKLIENVT